MKKSMINTCHIEGVLYEHNLEMKESGPASKNPGTIFITGTIDIATDNAMTNIVPVHFTYVTEKTSKGSTNATFVTLKNIIDGKYKSYMKAEEGEAPVKLRVDSALGLNEFYTDRNGQEELVSAKRNEGGFVHVVIGDLAEDENSRNTFKCDMLITNVSEKEADEERGLPAKVIVKGAIFDFRKSLLPIEFSAVNPRAMDYFLSLEASNANPTFTCVWGRQVSETIKREIRTESAFGEDEVRMVESSRKDFVITGAAKEPYDWDDESSLTAQEVATAITERETYLATLKQRYNDYKNAPKANTNTITPPSNSGFNF